MSKTPVDNETLLDHLLYYGHEPADYLEILENLELAEHDKEHFAAHPEETDQESLELLDADIELYDEKLRYMMKDWRFNRIPDMESEHRLIKKWVEDRQDW